MQKLLGVFFIVTCILIMFIPSSAQEKKGRGYYDFGVFAFEEGNYADAEKNIIKALEREPDEPKYHHLLGKTYMKTGQYAQSRKHYVKAYETDPATPGLKYDLGFLSYKQSNYSVAAEMFEQAVRDDPDNRLARYHAGVSLYKQDRYLNALGYFDKLPADKSNIDLNSAYYSAICHVRTGNNARAIDRFEYVRDHTDEPEVKSNAVQWIQRLRRGRGADVKPYSLNLKVGYYHDDNVRLDPVDIDLYTDEEDQVAEAVISARYNFHDEDGFVIGAGFAGLHTMHQDLDEYDLTGGNLNIFMKYHMEPATFGVTYLPTYYWLDGKDYLLRQHIRPEAVFYLNDDIAVRLTYSYMDNNYFTEYGRDGHTHDIFLDAFYSFGNDRGYAFVGGGIENVTATDKNYYYAQTKARLGMSLNLTERMNMAVTGRYNDRNYDYVDTDYGVKREDEKYGGTISLSHEIIGDWMSIGAEYTYTKNDSNINAYEYERNVVGGFMQVKF